MPEIDEYTLRQLMIRSTDDLFAPAAAAAETIRWQRRRRMRTRALGAAGTAAAAGLAVGTLVATSGTGARAGQGGSSPAGAAVLPARLTAAQHALFGLSAAAAATARPAGQYVVQTEQSTSIDTSPEGPIREIGGKTSVINTITGGGLQYQDITVSGAGSAGTPVPPGVLTAAPGTSPTVAQLDALPTDPAKLGAVLLAQARRQSAAGVLKSRETVVKKPGISLHVKFGPQQTANDLLFEQATGLLWEPDLSPALRSAVYKLLAATPGVIVNPHAADSSGRPAVEISRVDTAFKDDIQTFEDPTTGATLESAWRYPTGSFAEDLYLSTRYTNTIPADPYHG
jgi:hypothetical protein